MHAISKQIAAVATLISAPSVFAQSNGAASGIASIASSYWEWAGPWHMHGGWGLWWLFPLLMMFFIVALCAFFMTRVFGGAVHGHSTDTTSSALRLLNERFARGEISKEELEDKRTILGAKS